MATSVICPECGNRERRGMMQDGECRDCRGGHTEAVMVERARSPYDEMRSRHRIIAGVAAREVE